MPGTEIEAFIEELEDLINNAKSPLSGGGSKKIIEADTAYAILDDIKRSLPEEFQKARRILRERDEIIEEANTQANHTIDDANAQASIMVSEQEVVRLANNMAADIKRHAEEDARDTRYWAEGVADKTLEQLQNQLHIVIDMASHLLDQTQECRNLLTGVAQADEPADFPSRAAWRVPATRFRCRTLLMSTPSPSVGATSR